MEKNKINRHRDGRCHRTPQQDVADIMTCDAGPRLGFVIRHRRLRIMQMQPFDGVQVPNEYLLRLAYFVVDCIRSA